MSHTPSTTTQPQPTITTYTDQQPASSIEPAIRGGQYSHLEQRIHKYLHNWYQTTPDEFTIDWSQITIAVTKQLKIPSGRYVWHKNQPQRNILKIAHGILTDGLTPYAQSVIRHEAVHVWQQQTHDTVNHGPTFQRWTDPFNIDTTTNRTAEPAQYVVTCPHCGPIDAKMHQSDTIKQIQTNTRACKHCGSDQLSVYKYQHDTNSYTQIHSS